MATYYKWRKSTIKYTESTKPIPTGDTDGYNWSNGAIRYQQSKPDYITTAGIHRGDYNFSSATFKDLSPGETKDMTGLYWMVAGVTASNAYKDYMYFGGTAHKWELNPDGNSYLFCNGPATRYDLDAGPGTSAGYTYSTSASAYPNDAISGDYWYDQRTTITSPVAPTGLTYPNQIATSAATVSWTASVTNVPIYAVSTYEVSYSTNKGSTWTVAGNTEDTSLSVDIPAGATSIQFRVRAQDSNGQWSSYTIGSVSNILFAPSLTVPFLAMQGQDITITWTAIDGATSYTIQRKSNIDDDWVQVYSGNALTFTETAGAWSSAQYRVQATFAAGTGDWSTSDSIPVISASALVISGQDGDLGTLVNDVPYTISTDTGKQITVRTTVNGVWIFDGMVESGTAKAIPVLDLLTGDGTIVIEASVETNGGAVSAKRTWTYKKELITFPNSGSPAEITKEKKTIWPKTLAECVRMPGGRTLDNVIANATIALLASGWKQESGLYKQTVDCPIVWTLAPMVILDPNLTGEDQAADDQVLQAWQSGPGQKAVVQGEGTLTFFSATAPTINIPVNVGVV